MCKLGFVCVRKEILLRRKKITLIPEIAAMHPHRARCPAVAARPLSQ